MKYDVVIVGGGGSGLAAAARCCELGLSAIVLEKQAQLGGTTGIAVGSFTANRTPYQKRQHIDDSVEAHAEDAGKFAPPDIEAFNNEALRREFLSHSGATLEWLEKLGLVFHGPSPEPPNRIPRMHNVVPNAKAYIAALHALILRKGGTILCNAEVTQLIIDQNRVTGVEIKVDGTFQKILAERGVVLAAGDYANSPELIRRFKGEQFSVIEGINPFATGQGHCLAEQAGAKLINMSITYGPELRFLPPKAGHDRFLQLIPSSGPLAKLMAVLLPYVPQQLMAPFIKRLLVTWQHPEDSLFTDGAILVNQQGERFCDETKWPGREIAVAKQSGKIAYILLDQKLINRYSQWPHFISTAPEIAYAYVDDYLKLRGDVAVKCSTIHSLAQARAIPESNLMATVRHHASELQPDSLASFTGQEWALLGPVKAWFTTTEGGAAITPKFEVLNENKETIPGLYAIGQNGLGGQILWGHGLHIAWAITSGKRVAEHLAATTTE